MLTKETQRPAHIHFMVTAPKMETLVTAIYPEGDTYLTNDAVFGVKRSLVVVRVGLRLHPPLSLLLVSRTALLRSRIAFILLGRLNELLQHFDDVSDPAEGQKRGIPGGKPFKLLQFDIVLKKEDEGIEQPKSHL